MKVAVDTNIGEVENASTNVTSAWRKRKAVNCNIDKMADLAYKRALDGAADLHQKRQRLEIEGNKQLAAKQQQQRQSQRKRSASYVPPINFTALIGYNKLCSSGPHESRTIVGRLLTYEKLANCGGGFRLFLRLVTDAVLNEICNKIDDQGKRYKVSDNMDLYVAQVLRYAWSQLSEKERIKYECAAREEMLKFYKTEMQDMTDNEENIGPDESMSEANKERISSLPAMPLTEFPFMSEWTKKQKEEERRLKDGQSRCPLCEDFFLKDDTLQVHILYGHFTLYIYACQCCFEGFISLEQLERHRCQGFAQFALLRLSNDLKFEMRFAMHTLVCAECNLQVPLSSSSLKEPSLNKRNMKLQCLLKNHNTNKLTSCVTLFPAEPVGVEYVTVKVCAMKYGIPLRCQFCSHQFTSAADIEKHQTGEHSGEVTKLKCPVCPGYYVTDLFYRDHLLSHLREAYSLTGLLEKATFYAPSFSARRSLRMGPSLQKIIGSDIFSRVDKPKDASDDEDLSFDKSLLKKRDESGGSKGKKIKKSTSKSKRALCYYCKQLKQLLPNMASLSDLCRCSESISESKSLVAKNSLINSLLERFSREARLYVDKKDSIFDTAMGAIIDDSVFICVKCKGLHLGEESMLKHLRICMQKDVESPNPEKYFDLMDTNIVIRLTQPHYSPKGRISCPECEETSCSIAGLRRHLALEHGIYAYYNTPDGRRGIGILEYVPSFPVDKAKHSTATRTNVELGLTELGGFKLEKKVQQSPTTSNVAGNNANSVSPTSVDVQSVQTPRQATEMSLTARSTLMQAFTEPAKSSTVKDKLTCVVCFTQFRTSQNLASHFVRCHLQLCSDCGCGFVDKQSLQLHAFSCQKWVRKCADGEFFPRCQICNFLVLTPERYFYHLVHCHETSMTINEKKQEISPMFLWKKLSLADAERLKKDAVNKPPADAAANSALQTAPSAVKNTAVAEPVVGEKFSCVLCELDFPNQAECNSHLQKHPEQWICCPVCRYFKDNCPVRTVDELFAHLLSAHATKSVWPKGVKIVCSLCRTISSCEFTSQPSIKRCEDQMIRHILYSCNGARVCFICNDGVVYTQENLKKHRLTEHYSIFKRFGCSECPRTFHTCSAFRKHSCNVLLKCSCGSRVLFSEREFQDHFKDHLNAMNDFCLLCNKYLFSRDQLSSHMLAHRIIVNGKRQLVQLNLAENLQVLFKTPHSAPMSNNAPSAQQTQSSSSSSVGNIFQFRNVKANDDDEIQFLGFGDQRKENADDNDVVCVTETVPTNFMTNVRSEVSAAAATIICEHPMEPTPTVQIPIETDQAAISDITERIIRAIISPLTCPYFTAPSYVEERNCPAAERTAVEKERKTENTGKQATPTEASSNPLPADDDLQIVAETYNKSSEGDEEGAADESKKLKSEQSEGGNDSDLEIIEDVCTNVQEIEKARREAKFRCSQCTEKFLTKAALQAHKETHRYDAGQTLEAVYGVPIETTVHICRLCCLAYESKVVYQRHMRTHGVLRSCDQCSVVAFNEEQMKSHQEQHRPAPQRQVMVYVCAKCVTTYSTDERLYHHMFNVHSQPILYFCKNCGLANTNGRHIFQHIARNECAWQVQSQATECPNMGFAAACVFHYQPVNPSDYENRVRNNQLLVIVPSECIHRSFLSQANDNICITCPVCHSLMSFLRLQAENPKFTGSLPRSLSHAADDNNGMLLAMLNIWAQENAREQNFVRTAAGYQQSPVLVNMPSVSPFVVQQAISMPPGTFVTSMVPATAPTAINANNAPAMTALASLSALAGVSQQNQTVGGTAGIDVRSLASSPPRLSPSAQVPSMSTRPAQKSSAPSRAAARGSSKSARPAARGSSKSVRPAATRRRPAAASSAAAAAAAIAATLFPASTSQAANTRKRAGSTNAARQASSPSLPSVPSTSSQADAGPSTIPSSPKPFARTPPYKQPYRGALEAVGLTVGTQMATRDYIVRTAEGRFFCARTECSNVRIEKMTSGRVHNLRHNPQNIFFCLECGSAFMFENLIVRHMIEFHHDFQEPEYWLRCPLCPDREPFTHVLAFKKHMAEPQPEHGAVKFPYVFKQRCKLQFGSIEARLRHDQEHQATKNAPCCFVCGTSRNWWFSAAREDFPRIDHSFIHAFSLWGMCRECGLCHPNELKNLQFFQHFRREHMTQREDGGWYCRICNKRIDRPEIETHALQRHFVIGVKTDRRKPYRVEISASMMRAFLGYQVPEDAKI